MSIEPFGRLDNAPEIRELLLPHCRLKNGDVWEDKTFGHKVGVLDAAHSRDVQKILVMLQIYCNGIIVFPKKCP